MMNWVWRKAEGGWQHRLVVASDGSCPDQQAPARFRRSAAAIFVGKSHAMNCVMKTMTKTQGAQRAETKGAARWAAWANCPTELWTDSEHVIEGLNDIRKNGHHKRKKHRDLWDKIQRNLEVKGLENFSWKWVESHRTREEAIKKGEYEEWYRNDCADKMAQEAAKENCLPKRLLIKYKDDEKKVVKLQKTII